MNGSCHVHEWIGQFHGERVRFKMTSVCGHVMSLDFLARFNSWDRVDPAVLFTAGSEKKETTPKLRMREFLSREAEGCRYLVLWLDCDKEGENICFEVIDAVRGSIHDLTLGKTVLRAKFSAITERDLRAALGSLVSPNIHESRSVDARQELDLRIGCAFTRFQTKYFQDRYGDLDSTLISYGPCQTPTLGFCVDRHDQIQAFKPQKYWKLTVTCTSEDGYVLEPQWTRLRCFDREVISMFLSRIENAKTCKVESVVCKEKTKPRPLALNTVELMRVASSSLGMGPHYAMTVAERLYIQGFISYPRTETTKYPANFDISGTLRDQVSSQSWGDQARQLLSEGVARPRAGTDVGDHPPITPMRAASHGQLDGDAWRIYQYVVQHFIASVHRDCCYLSTTVSIRVADELFSVCGQHVIDAGFTAVFDWQAIGSDQSLPEFKVGQILQMKQTGVSEHVTAAPDYLTESELITLMERHGIGTDASIPVHINNIGQRNYVTVQTSGARRLVPTQLGIVLVHGYRKIDADLVLPTMRSAVEKQLALIAQDRADYASVLQHTLDVFSSKFQYFVTNVSGMDQLFEASFSPLAATGRPFSRCGKCRRYMRLVETRPARLHCAHCSETYSLPTASPADTAAGSVRVFDELRCPLDQFDLLVWSTGKKGRGFVFCPYCYNHPPFSDMRKGTGCDGCSHSGCMYSLNRNGVSSCVKCPSGVLVLFPASAPHWRLVCNRCDVIISVFDQAEHVSVADSTCDQCGSYLLNARYKQEKSRLRDRATECEGCVFCSPLLRPLVHAQQATQRAVGRHGSRARRGQRARGARGRVADRAPVDKMAEVHYLVLCLAACLP